MTVRTGSSHLWVTLTQSATTDSDSDTSIQQHTNRGNKLKRHAAHVREGRLDTTGGRSYRKKIVHAGYQRYIIHKNPTRYDEDGDVVEDDGEDEDGQASPDEENPFGETKLECATSATIFAQASTTDIVQIFLRLLLHRANLPTTLHSHTPTLPNT